MTSPDPRPIALAGIGKIARDEHVPAIAASPGWTLAATVSRNAGVDGVEGFAGIDAFLDARPEVGTVSLALPPGPRFGYAAACIAAGRHVMLEKPPGATLGECHALAAMARDAGVTLFATWHSREGAAVAATAERLAGADIRRVAVSWREDVRHWHPGQDWVWEPGNLGVFDPGINALSILTRILPGPLRLTAADLHVPEGRQTPIAARLEGRAGAAELAVDLDWLHRGDPEWTIAVDTAAERLTLEGGGARLLVDGEKVAGGDSAEYPALYARMAELVGAGESDVDLAPMVLVADAFALGRRHAAEPFDW